MYQHKTVEELKRKINDLYKIGVSQALKRLDTLVMAQRLTKVSNEVIYYKLKRDLRRMKKIAELEISELPGAFINVAAFKYVGDKRFKCLWQIVRE